MQREDLREATASELLTEKQEYQMQQSWFADEESMH